MEKAQKEPAPPKVDEKLKSLYKRQLESQKEAYELVVKQQHDRISSLEASYKSLEDEFRAGLTYEAQRYADLLKRYETTTTEIDRLRESLSRSEANNERSQALIGELNELIKEQKARLAGLVQLRKEKQEDVQKRNARLSEAVAEVDSLKEQLEAGKKDKINLESKLKTVYIYLLLVYGKWGDFLI